MIEGCKHGPTFLIPQPCADCERERHEEAERLTPILNRLNELKGSAPPHETAPPLSVEEIVVEMLNLYAVNFTDKNSRQVCIESWVRQLRASLSAAGTPQPELLEKAKAWLKQYPISETSGAGRSYTAFTAAHTLLRKLVEVEATVTQEPTLKLLKADDIRASRRASTGLIHIGGIELEPEHARRIAYDILELLSDAHPEGVSASPRPDAQPKTCPDCGCAAPFHGDGCGPMPLVAPSTTLRKGLSSRLELQMHLDAFVINSENIGDIRRSLFVDCDSAWNSWVRDETAARENISRGGVPSAPSASASPRPDGSHGGSDEV